RRIWGLGRRDRQRARELAEVDGVLDNVGLKAVATERTRREFGVERQSMNPLSRGFGPAPGIIRKSDHLNCIPGGSTSISNSRSSCIGRIPQCGSTPPRRILDTAPCESSWVS